MTSDAETPSEELLELLPEVGCVGVPHWRRWRCYLLETAPGICFLYRSRGATYALARLLYLHPPRNTERVLG